MTFYHGTSEENWKSIQDEGVLWGRRFIVDDSGNPVKEVSRCTYLSTESDVAEQYGDVVLEVEYDQYDRLRNIRRDRHGPLNNYSPDSWQMRVYEPIEFWCVKKL